MKSGAAFVGFLFAAAVGFGFGYAVGTGKQGASPSAPVADNKPSDPGKPATAEDIFKVPVGTSFAKGPADALVTIVEFSDFQCPFCRRFHDETYQDLLDAYPGQIRFVYRNLPLTSIHPDAMPAAVASLCANDQQAYWDYHGKLFSSEALTRETFIQYATDLNLNVEDFTACLDSGKFDEFIQQDMEFALNLGVQSTPTFFVNGLAIVGAQPLSSFTQIIDLELAGEIP